MANSETKKRKHLALSIMQKVELLQKLDRGVSVQHLTEEYGVGRTTVYDLQKKKDKLLKYYSDSDDKKCMKNRKTLHRAKNEALDHVLMEWIQQRRSEHIPLTGLMVMKQAKIYHKELKLEGECKYSDGWLQKFKKRNGVKYLKIFCEKASPDHEAAEKYIEEFAKIISDENLSSEQIYNADEIALYWRYVSRTTLTTADERAPTGFKNAKDRLTILGCANAAGTHKVKLAVIGKSKLPRCLKGVHNLPVHYYLNKRAQVTREMFSDWFNNNFVPAARAHCRQAGLKENSKILLFLDTCSAHLPIELLVKSNVFAVYLPPNVTSILQPRDQRILSIMKNKYKDFLNCMLATVNRGVGVQDFLKEFSVKDAIYAIANAWKDVDKPTLTNAWHKLWPTMMFDVNDTADENLEGFCVSNEKKKISNLVTYAKRLPDESVNKLEEADNDEMLNIDNDVPVVHSLGDGKIAEMVLNTDKHEASSHYDIVDTGEKVPIDDIVKMCDRLITALNQRAFISEQDIMAIYSVKEQLLRQKSMLMRQMSLEEVFRNAISHGPTSSLENTAPGPSSDAQLQTDDDDDVGIDVPSSPRRFANKTVLFQHCTVALKALDVNLLECHGCKRYFCSSDALSCHECVKIKMEIKQEIDNEEVDEPFFKVKVCSGYEIISHCTVGLKSIDMKNFESDHCTKYFNSNDAVSLNYCMKLDNIKIERKEVVNLDNDNESYSCALKTVLSKNVKAVYEKCKPFQCSECSYRVAQKFRLSSHIKAVHEKCKPFQCSKCSYRGAQKFHLSRHIKAVHENCKPFQCSKCSYRCARKVALSNHLKAIHEKCKPFQCSECSFRCAERVNISRHAKAVHEKCKQFQCSKCSYSSRIKADLSYHLKAVHEIFKPFQCSNCSYSCAIKGCLTYHVKAVHEKYRPFQCANCSYRCASKSRLSDHIKAVHEKCRPFQCSDCSFTCAKRTALSLHIKAVHEKCKPFQCLNCSYRCANRMALSRHVKVVHEKFKPFQCSECSYICARKFDLSQHVKAVHEKFKPFQCSLCSYRASQKNHLSLHILTIHEKCKPFQCSNCSYRCTSKSVLSYHVKAVHEKYKPFQCSECSYRCAQKVNISRHVNAVHEKCKPFQCSKCLYRFHLKVDLACHVKAVHENLKPLSVTSYYIPQPVDMSMLFTSPGSQIYKSTIHENVKKLPSSDIGMGSLPTNSLTLKPELDDIKIEIKEEIYVEKDD